jgi:uncharacterized protein with PQ loop repeat
MRMESYQSIGIVMGVVGIIIAIGLGAAQVPSINGWVVVAILFVSFIGLVISLVNKKHHKGVGITMIILGCIGNLLLIVPGIMAIRYKPTVTSGAITR